MSERESEDRRLIELTDDCIDSVDRALNRSAGRGPLTLQPAFLRRFRFAG